MYNGIKYMDLINFLIGDCRVFCAFLCFFVCVCFWMFSVCVTRTFSLFDFTLVLPMNCYLLLTMCMREGESVFFFNCTFIVTFAAAAAAVFALFSSFFFFSFYFDRQRWVVWSNRILVCMVVMNVIRKRIKYHN